MPLLTNGTDARQVVPPSRLSSVTALLHGPTVPVIQTVLAPTAATPQKWVADVAKNADCHDVTAVQVEPPSVVRSTMPRSPTAHAVVASTAETARKAPLAATLWRLLLAPPSVVLRIVPPSPTAQAVLASAAATP